MSPEGRTGSWVRHRLSPRLHEPQGSDDPAETIHQEARAAALLEFAGALAEAGRVPDVDRAIVRFSEPVCGAAGCAVFDWDPAAGLLRAVECGGYHPDISSSLGGLEISSQDTSLLSATLEAKEPLILRREDVEDPFVVETMDRLDASLSVAVCVEVLGAPFRVITLTFDSAPPMLGEDVLRDRLKATARLAARAYENTSVLQSQTERVQRLGDQKQILEMIARGDDLREILEAVCTTIDTHISGSMSGVLLLDDEGQGLQTVACPNLPSGFVWELNGLNPGPFTGAAGTAVFREHAVFSADVETDRIWNERRAIARRHGIQAAWAMPIFAAGTKRILGAVAVYLERTGNPSDPERAFLEMAAQLSSIAIERKELESRLTHQAFHDALTGLPNRALFSDRVQHALDRTARHDEPIALLLLDLDDFKAVNDRLGHSAGDELLRTIAERLRGCLRSADTPARLGGDEFAILLEGTDEASARAIAARILDEISQPIVIMGSEFRIGGSVGIALGTGSKERMPDLLRSADTAMYAAKGGGKGRIEIFEDRMQSGLVKRLETRTELHRALEQDEFVLHYQPVFRMRPHVLIGVEALVRWEHPSRGLLPPSEFISVAEDSGLIVEIGREVLRKACAQARIWMDLDTRRRPFRFSVNFSVRQLRDPALADEVADILRSHAVPPKALVVEVTESALMEDPKDVAATLGRMKEMGVHVAIDDFGTGYSSLSYLRRFPVDILKIDRFFVQGLDAGPEEAAYARAIVRLGHSLDLEVVAEGVETTGEYEALMEMGCDFAQGFRFAAPLPPDKVVEVPGFLDAASTESDEPG